MTLSEPCKDRRGGRCRDAEDTLVSEPGKLPQVSFHAGTSVRLSRGKFDRPAAAADAAALAGTTVPAAPVAVRQAGREALLSQTSDAARILRPSTQSLKKRQQAVPSSAAAEGKGDENLSLSCPTSSAACVSPPHSACSPPAAKTAQASSGSVAASTQSYNTSKPRCSTEKTPTALSTDPKAHSSRAPHATSSLPNGCAVALAGASTAGAPSSFIRPVGALTITDAATAATSVSAPAVTADAAALGPDPRVGVLRAAVSRTAATAAEEASVAVDARSKASSAPVHDTCDETERRSTGEAAACSSGGGEDTSGLTTWERRLLLRSPGALVLQQVPAGVSRAELSEFFRKHGALQPPGDGLYFPCQRRQQVVVRFQRLQDAAKCLRVLQQQRLQPAMRDSCSGVDGVTGLAARSTHADNGVAAGRPSKPDEYCGEDDASLRRTQQQSTGLQELLQQEYPGASLLNNCSSSSNAAIRLQGVASDEARGDVVDRLGERNWCNSTSLLGCACVQLSRADKIKISALRGYQRAVQLVRSEGILNDLQHQQEQQQRQRAPSDEQVRLQQEAQTHIKNQQMQQTPKLLSTQRGQQVRTACKLEENQVRLRSTSTAAASATAAAAQQQEAEGHSKSAKASSTTKRSATHSAVPSKRSFADVTAAEGEARGGVLPNSSYSADSEKEGHLNRRPGQQMHLRGENPAGGAAGGPAAAAAAATTRQQQPRQSAAAAATATPATGAGGVGKNAVASAAGGSRANAMRHSSSSNSLLELLSGAAVVEHLEKRDAAAAASWGSNSSTCASGQNSKQQQRPQTAAWGEVPVLDPVLDADRIRYLRARSEAAHAAMMTSLAGFLFFQDNPYENFLIPALPRCAAFATGSSPPAVRNPAAAACSPPVPLSPAAGAAAYPPSSG